jgi:formylglycine-generating enzyme required for sulfatase activity
VGAFPGGASPYGALDLSGNVWEWTRSLWGEDYRKPDYTYPYDPSDGREDESAGREVARVLRGGAYYVSAAAVRCGRRYGDYPRFRLVDIGFRVVVSPG